MVTQQKRRFALKHLCPKNGPYIDIAPVSICVFCENSTYYLEDGSAATQNILNAAHMLGLGAVWVAGDKKDYAEDVRKLFGLPENYKLVSIVVIGYPDGEITPTPRKSLEEVMIWDHSDAPADYSYKDDKKKEEEKKTKAAVYSAKSKSKSKIKQETLIKSINKKTGAKKK